MEYNWWPIELKEGILYFIRQFFKASNNEREATDNN